MPARPRPPSFCLPATGRSFCRPVLVSAGVHVLVAAGLLWQAGRPSSPAGAAAASREGAGVLRAPAYLELWPDLRPAAAQPAAAPRLPRDPQALAAPPLRAAIVEEPRAAALHEATWLDPGAQLGGQLRTAGGGSSPAGGGLPGGWGGGGTGETGGRVFPPQARYTILPPLPRPNQLRGQTFRVHFWVDASGRVTRVEVEPPIPDGSYRKQFLQAMYQYRFTPARQPDGTPVASETTLTITL